MIRAKPRLAELHATFVKTVAVLWQILPVIIPIHLLPDCLRRLMRHLWATPGTVTEPQLRAFEMRPAHARSRSDLARRTTVRSSPLGGNMKLVSR